MTPTKTMITLLLLAAMACKQKKEEAPAPPPVTPNAVAAVQLNDSAMLYYGTTNDSVTQAKAVELLDQATTIDSNYVAAYMNKLMFLGQLKQYSKAIAAAKQVNRIMPDAPDPYITTAVLYEKTGDSVSPKSYYTKALQLYDKMLDTVNRQSNNFIQFTMSKGVVLVLNGEVEKGNKILRDLVTAKTTDNAYREYLENFINKSRQEMLYLFENPPGKEIKERVEPGF